MGEGFSPWFKAWGGVFSSEGAQVKVTSFEKTITGICLGVDDTGALLVRTPSGAIEKVISGDVEAVG